MLLTYKLLKRSWIVNSHEIIDYKQGSNWYYFKCKANLKNQTQLWIEESYESGNFYYSYHWQGQNSKLIKRWDNSPHHKGVSTFPHHIHTPDIEESLNPDFKSVLHEIEESIKKEQE